MTFFHHVHSLPLIFALILVSSLKFTTTSFLDDPELSSHCRSQGGTCGPMLSCLLKMGFVAGSCGGVFSVCCAQPSTVSRWIRENNHGSNHIGGGDSSSQYRSNHKKIKFLGSRYGPVVNDPHCGRPVELTANRRVLDGKPAGFGSFPWQALIRIGKGKCGGVLINRRHVVTAGHCVKNKPLSSLTVTLGEYHLKLANEPYPSEKFRVTRAVVHPRFQFSPAADRYDVAVLTIDRPVQYAPHIAPICLPEAGRDPAPGTNAYVAGWGALIPDDVAGPLIPFLLPEIKRPSVLQVVNVPVLDNERCETWHKDKGFNIKIWPEMVCAGYRQGGKDSCKGDSGGPLMVQQRDGRWVLVGIVSAGFSCGKPGQPGIYHRISSTSDWVTYYANPGFF
ncbi:serine protease 33 [Lepeophtheirus salmonis]|uniref:Peptidase S1 domain-containing protein n=1 Tax=Lepeophtheirus salmonis TaxID=72036 RepID=A0A0K2UUX3_LEPSM|nr:serine proteinase stubble-like [Lepeophtheirus salmonis]